MEDNIIKITLMQENDQSVIHDLVCGDIKIKSNFTTFSDRQKYNTLQVNNFAYSSEDNTFEPKPIKMECVVRNESDAEGFKKALRKTNNSFLLKVENFGKVRYSLCKRNEEEMELIYSKGMYTLKFSLIQFSHWFEITTASFEFIDSIENYESAGYANSDGVDDGIEDNEYIYNESMVYSGSPQTLGTLMVELPNNDSDRGAYVRVDIFECELSPKYGLNYRYDSNAVEQAYISDDDVGLSEETILTIDSYPPNLKIVLRDDVSETNIQQRRDFEKSPYLFLEKEENVIVFTNVRRGRVQLYKLYVQPW